MDDEVPRFRGETAPLAALAAQVRLASRAEDKAIAAGRLARQLMRRRIELRDALALAEKSLSIHLDPELAVDVARWWAAAGDPIRGAGLANSMIAELPEDRRAPALLEVGRLYCRTGQVHQAAQALRRVMELDPEDPRAFELFGSLGFWADMPKAECARSLLIGASLRKKLKEDTASFEDRLRAFEVDPTSNEAARELAAALRRRGRVGAADEILREHLRKGSAAARAAHHQRLFYSSLANGELTMAFESALEAELDADVDVLRLHALLVEGASLRQDFESFLVRLVRDQELGDGRPFAQWLLTLVEIHEDRDNRSFVRSICKALRERYELASFPELAWGDRDNAVRLLRARLAVERDPVEELGLRIDLARYECERTHFEDALAVIEPLLLRDDLPLSVGIAGAALAGRVGQPIARARALSALASYLPGVAAALAYAVAAERFVASGETEEAHRSADAAVEADPKNERAIASQSLVALRAPDGASASLLEHSLAVLVARSDVCRLLCDAARQRDAASLAQTWAARALSLRPGDLDCCRNLLRQARATGDSERIIEALLTILDQEAPLVGLADEVTTCLESLSGVPGADLTSLGHRVLSRFYLRSDVLTGSLRDLATSQNLPELTASLLELQLVNSGSDNRRALYQQLVDARLRAGNGVAAARSLRRLQMSGASADQVLPHLPQFAAGLEPDALLPLFELRAEFEEIEGEAETLSTRLFHAGAARWDMAQDTSGAIQSWLRAADEDPHRGLELFAHYLRTFAGSESACRHFKEAAKQTENPSRSGRLLGFAARELLILDRKAEAFGVAQTALDRAPLLTDILAIAEATASPDQVSSLDRLYETVAKATLGTFGERAVHYRAARQLEKRGDLDRALDHACAAFEAVPAEGVAFVLMARLADATLGHAKLISSIQRVADEASNDAERSRWLARGASLADSEGVGRKERTELLWRAAQMLPERETLDSLFDALAHQLADEPEARDELWTRFDKLATKLLVHATDSHGAELHVMFASVAITHFEQPDSAITWLSRAVTFDSELDEYRRLLPFATQIAGVPGPCTEFLELVHSQTTEGRMMCGVALAELSSRLAFLLSQKDVAAEILVRAAVDFPDDAELTAWAAQAVNDAARDDLRSQIEGLLPVEQRARELLARLEATEPERALRELCDLDLDPLSQGLRVAVLLETAKLREDAGALTDAAKDFAAALSLDPDNAIALSGVERDCERNGRHEELTQVLGKRIELSGDPGEVRRLSLRLAAILETRLGRAPDAREVLGKLIAEKEDRAALRMLADSWQRTGDSTEAAELWERVREVAEDVEESDDASFRAAQCYRDAGLVRKATEQVGRIQRPSIAHRRLALDVARENGDRAGELEQLTALTESPGLERTEAAELLLRAALLALDDAEAERALEFAERAAESPSPQARLLAVRLRVQLHGVPPSPRCTELKNRLPELESLEDSAERQLALYLEARLMGGEAAQDSVKKRLQEAPEELLQSPLLQIVLAELHVDDPKQALAFYESALGADLQGFYRPAEVFLRAGKAARAAGDFDRARGLISAVSDDDPLRVKAAKELEELAREEAKQKRLAREAKEQSESVAREKAAAERRAAAEQEAARAEDERKRREAERLEAEAKQAEEAARAEQERTEEAARAEEEREREKQERKEAERVQADEERRQVEVAKTRLEEQQRQELEAIRNAARSEHREATKTASEHAEPAPAAPARGDGADGSEESSDDRRLSQPPELLSAAVVGSLQASPVPSLDPPATPEPPPTDGAPTDGAPTDTAVELEAEGANPEESEQDLISALEAGDVDAGLRLLGRLDGDRSRSRDATVVAGHLVSLDPSDARLFGRLVATADKDGNHALSLSVRHILGAYGAGDAVSPPTLSQTQNPGVAGMNLVKQVQMPAHEALALVWEHAGALYKKDLNHYGISGIERVPHNAPTPLARLYGQAASTLDQMRTPLFRSGGLDEISIQVALLQSPAVLVSGKVDVITKEFEFHFGAMLAAASPAHALLFSLPQEEVQTLLDALRLSFGTGQPLGGRPSAAVRRVASFFWESIPPRVQRRLGQICVESEQLDYVLIANASRFALRRAGLLVCGDLSTAVDEACAELGIAAPRNLAELAAASARAPSVSDLLNLALSPEYAQLRFSVS